MSELSPIFLDDAAATPVNHEFVPSQPVGGVVTYRDTLGISVALKPRISLSMRPGELSKGKRIKRKVTVKINVPYQPISVDGITPAVDSIESVITLNVPLDASEADIVDIVKFQQDAFSETQLTDAIVSGNMPY